jgi:proline racemase
MREEFDFLRTALIHEPRGSEVMVGALVLPPIDSRNTAGIIFFNNVGYLGMCGGRLGEGLHVAEALQLESLLGHGGIQGLGLRV